MHSVLVILTECISVCVQPSFRSFSNVAITVFIVRVARPALCSFFLPASGILQLYEERNWSQ